MIVQARPKGTTRRTFIERGLLGSAALLTPLALSPRAWRALAQGRRPKGTLQLADIGVGDPGGDWSKFTEASGWDVNLVAIGNAPSAIINVLLAGGGRQVYDLINIVGGMQPPLVENGFVEEIDTSRIPNWAKNPYIERYLSPGTPGFNFIGYDGRVYGVPTVFQGDSIAYLPDVTGPIDSLGALFDPKWRGYVALEDNYTTAGQKTALYLKATGQASIENPDDMTPSEFRTVVDFLIEKKREGQFRVIWTGFEQAVDLLVQREVYVMDCWEPMVYAARQRGVNVEYAVPREGYLLWAMAAYIVKKPQADPERLAGVYELLDFMLGPWYGAKIALLNGYLTNPQAVAYAQNNPDEFTEEEAQTIARIVETVEKKFELGGTWQNRWPTHIDAYEEEWARFKAAPSGR